MASKPFVAVLRLAGVQAHSFRKVADEAAGHCTIISVHLAALVEVDYRVHTGKHSRLAYEIRQAAASLTLSQQANASPHCMQH